MQRLVSITGVGAGGGKGHGGLFYDWIFKPLMLRKVCQDKDRQEAIGRSTGLDWVIVRPTLLTDTPALGKVTATVDLKAVHGGKISRADFARFVIEQTTDDRRPGRTPLITSA